MSRVVTKESGILMACGVLVAACWGNWHSADPDRAGVGDAGPLRPHGELSLVIDSDCATAVVQAGQWAMVRVHGASADEMSVALRVLSGDAKVRTPGGTADGSAVATTEQGIAQFIVECGGYGAVQLEARDAAGRVGFSPRLICARPSQFPRTCTSSRPSLPASGWSVEQVAPTGVVGRRLAPQGQASGTITDEVWVELRIVMSDYTRPQVPGRIEIAVAEEGVSGVTVEPAVVDTEPLTGEARVRLRAGPRAGTFRLRYDAELDGEVRTRESEVFTIVRPPTHGVTLACEGDLEPHRAFDANGDLRVGAAIAQCTLSAFSEDGGRPYEGSRVWALVEAGLISPRVRQLDADGQATFLVQVGGFYPADAPPAGPSALDGLVTVVAIVEGAEPFNDVDGDGVFTDGVDGIDAQNDSAEPFVDANDSGEFEPGERFFDTDGDNDWTGPNGVWDASTLLWTSTRLRWVGPVADDERTIELACTAPHCSRSPVPGFHDHCPDDALAYLMPTAVVDGVVRVGDRNGQCTAMEGAAELVVDPPEAALVMPAQPIPLGPCGPAGLAPEPFRLHLKDAWSTTIRLWVVVPDYPPMERTLCAPASDP